MPDWTLVWNEALAKEAVELHDVPADKIFVTGAPVFDKNGHLLGFLAYQIEKSDNEANETPQDNTVSEIESYVVIPAESARVIAQSIINRLRANVAGLEYRAVSIILVIPAEMELLLREL